MEAVYPIITKENTKDGYIIRKDYGPGQGCTTTIVHLTRLAGEERKYATENINRIIRPHGYELAM